MQERTITFDRMYQREYDFALGVLERAGVLCAPTELGRRLGISVATVSQREERLLSDIIEEILMTGFKWRYYTGLVQKRREVEDVALIFCLLDFDSGAERVFFRERIFAKSINIHPDAVYNFAMKEVRSVWESYARLILDFYDSEPDREDKRELIAYMLSHSPGKSSPKRIRYTVSSEERDIILQNIFFYRKRGVYIPAKYPDVRELVEELFGKYEKV